VGKLRMSDGVEHFLLWARKNRKPGTVSGYEHYLKRFLKETKVKYVDELTPAIVETWSNKWHPIQAIQRLCSYLHRHAKLLKFNPLEGMSRPTTQMRRRVLSLAEQFGLLRHANRHLRRLLMALRETIARPLEIREATWECVRTAGNLPFDRFSLVRGLCFFYVEAGKGFHRRTNADEVRVVTIPPRLGRLMARLLPRDGSPSGLIFTDPKGRAWTGTSLREAMRNLRKRAGFEADWRGERVVAYTMRHTGATSAVAAGVRDAMLSAILGHSTPRMTRRYVHLSPDMIQEGMGKIVEAKTKRKRKP
jgi:integrase